MIPIMVSMVEGLLKLATEVYLKYPEANAELKLTPPARKAIRALMEYPVTAEGWRKPGDLKQAAGSETKTTQTWKELDTYGFLEVSNEPRKDRGRITRPTRFRLKYDTETVLRILITLFKYHDDFKWLLLETSIQPPQYFVDHKKEINQAIRELKNKKEVLSSVRARK